MKKTIDYKIAGTKLPKILPDCMFSTAINLGGGWTRWTAWSPWGNMSNNLFSFGFCNIDDEICIKAEEKGYLGKEFFLFKLIDVLKSAKEFNSTSYIVPFDIQSFGWIKGDIALLAVSKIEYYVKSKRGLMPKEFVETWEQIIENESITINVGTSKTPIVIAKDSISVENQPVNIKYITDLFYPNTKSINKTDGKKLYDVTLVDATYKIGCNTITLNQLKEVIAAHNNLK